MSGSIMPLILFAILLLLVVVVVVVVAVFFLRLLLPGLSSRATGLPDKSGVSVGRKKLLFSFAPWLTRRDGAL